MENVYVGGIDEGVSCLHSWRFGFCTFPASAHVFTRARFHGLSPVKLIDNLPWFLSPPRARLSSCHDELSGLIQFNIELIFGSCRRRRPPRSNPILI